MNKTIVFFNVEGKTIVELSDIENPDLNHDLEVNSIDDFYRQIREKDFKIDYTNGVDDALKEIFNEESIDTPSLSEYKIKHWVSNRSFGELIDMYNSREIVVPDMQRSFVWDSTKCSRLIESIIMGLPIPPLFLLEVDDNKYELIDGFQRLTALSNYVSGRQWNFREDQQKRVIASKLSSKVAPEIAGKTFENLDNSFKTKIKRSTIPLIEFRQLDPLNLDSKYLIFERINTGSIKLNDMQIRKSLSYGTFMKSLYESVDQIKELKNIFSPQSIKKDMHVEAVLRTYCFYKIYYEKYDGLQKNGIKNILNYFCENIKNEVIDPDFIQRMNESLDILLNIFSKDELFKRIEAEGEKVKYVGNLNVSIMESIIAAFINHVPYHPIDKSLFRSNYENIMKEIAAEGIEKGVNPFSISTGKIESINERFRIAEKIVLKSINHDS